MNSKTLFVEILRATEGLPAALREHADDAQNVEERRFDHSYIEFLDTQIRLSPREPEWTELLKLRRAALLPFCDATLLRGNVRVGKKDFTVQIDPKSKAVIHWEQYDCDDVTS